MNFIALDFETATGQRHSMCAVGLVVVKENVIVEKYYSLIQPPNNEFTVYTIEVHKILPEFTKNAPGFPKVYHRLKSYLEGMTVVCHNADFDIDVLGSTTQYYGLEPINIGEVICTMRLSDGNGLADCCEKLQIPLNHHDPLSDAEACAMVYLYNQPGTTWTKKVVDSRISQNFENFSLHVKISSDLLKPDLEHVKNKENYFYGKKVVISGIYDNWPDRNELAMIIKELGADIDTSVTKRTNILIAGDGVGPSKLNKMIANINEGLEAVILNENDVVEILNEINN